MSFVSTVTETDSRLEIKPVLFAIAYTLNF